MLQLVTRKQQDRRKHFNISNFSMKMSTYCYFGANILEKEGKRDEEEEIWKKRVDITNCGQWKIMKSSWKKNELREMERGKNSQHNNSYLKVTRLRQLLVTYN